DGVFDGAHQVECRFGILVDFTVDNHVKAFDSILDVYQYAFEAGKLLGNVEWLRQEALHPARPRYHQLILFRKFVHTQDGDDVLKFIVALEDFLYALGRIVVFLAEYGGSKDPRGRVQGVYRRVDTELGNLTRKYRSGVQVGKRRSRSGVRQVIRRHVYRLHGSNGTPFGRG